MRLELVLKIRGLLTATIVNFPEFDSSFRPLIEEIDQEMINGIDMRPNPVRHEFVRISRGDRSA